MAVTGRSYKTSIYQQVARIGKAVACPSRLELLDLLCQAPRSVEELARQSGQTLANVSRHLGILRDACLVVGEKRGQHVVYRLADPAVCDFYRALQDLAVGRLAEIERATRAFLEERDAMEAIGRDELMSRVGRGEVLVVDVRPSEEYAAGHLPGAVSIPLADLERRLDEIPRDRTVVAYCRGPFCVLAVEAVRTLHSRGLQATRLPDGVLEWRAAGLPLERTP